MLPKRQDPFEKVKKKSRKQDSADLLIVARALVFEFYRYFNPPLNKY
jgi:hypothetical protein